MRTWEIKGVRNESDLYGYTVWLAEHLGLEIYPRALRGFQHGWIWWDLEEGSRQGLDINLDEYWGELVQDEHVEMCLRKQKIYAKACGLPFLNYLEFSGAKGYFPRTGGLLYIPTHSNPWNDVKQDVLESSIRFSKKYPDSSIMLSWSDQKLAPELAPYFKTVEIGAGALEMTSFPRMSKIFQTYDTMLTDAIGSHVLYGIACGMKVGIDASIYYDSGSTESAKKTIDFIRSKEKNYTNIYSSLDYLDRRFPGLVIDGNHPDYCVMPDFPVVEPKEIAALLGWPITYECELAKREN
jgi:hypothetical protein